MSQPPKRKTAGLGSNGGLSKKHSAPNNVGNAVRVNVLKIYPLIPFAPAAVVVVAHWIGGAS